MSIQPTSKPKGSVYRQVLRNRAWMLLWSGQTVSTVGDTFFNLAVVWAVYTQSGSALRTAVIQVVWQLSSTLFSPLAGALTDRWDRKRIMIIANVLSAVVVGVLAAVIFAQGQVSPLVIFVAVFLLNSLNTFFAPATFSIMPEVVGRDLLVTASGLFSSARQVASLIGSALAGVVIVAVGVAWAVVADALSFLFAALSIAVAPLPARTLSPSSSEKRPSLLHEVIDGWRTIVGQPVVWVLVWLAVLINVASFMGPLIPALVRLRLHGGAEVYGTLQAVSIIGGMSGGALAGVLERRLGAGRLLAAGWSLAGVCVLGIAASTSLPLTVVLQATQAFGLIVSGVSINALMQALVPENYRGRVYGFTAGLAVVAIPLSALTGGWLADLLGPAPLFAVGGAWILGVAGLAWSNRHIRTARI